MAGVMTPASTDQDRSDFVSVAEAARRLGTSVATVKRRIRAGTLEAEQLQRPQGFEYRVRIQRDEPAPVRDDAPPSIERSDSVQPTPFTGTTQDVSAAIAAATAPLVAELTASRQANERQADQLVRQAETIGPLRAELAAQRAENATLLASTAEQAPQPTQAPSTRVGAPWWRRWPSVAYR